MQNAAPCKRKKSIFILSNSSGGLIHFRREVISSLCAEYKVIISIPEDQDQKALQEIGAQVVGSPMERKSKNPLKDLILLRQYDRLLKQYKPDLVLTYTIKPNIYGGWASQRNRIPYIANITGLGTSIENGGILSKISCGLYRIGLKKASCVFFQNEANLHKFTNWGIISGRTRLLPGSGVNLAAHPLADYPAQKEPVRFLFMGRIMKDKGIEELLYAVKRMHEKGYPVHLDIIGTYDENYRDAITEAQKCGVVQYHGYQSDVNVFIKNAHCVVLPSYHEGMSNVMLEAAASGRPVITTNVPGCRETFDEGITGLGCEAGDQDSLLKAMERFFSIPNAKKAEMGLRGHMKIAKEFNRDIIIQAYLEEVHNLIQG